MMFWYESYIGCIEGAYMDGSQQRAFVTNVKGEPVAMTFDPIVERFYWSIFDSNRGSIHTSKLDGTDR
jgi:hypothetical protein